MVKGILFSYFLGIVNYVLMLLIPNWILSLQLPLIFIWLGYFLFIDEQMISTKWIPHFVWVLASYELAFLGVGISEQNTLLASAFNQLSLIYTLFFCSKQFQQSELDFNINRFLCDKNEKKCVLIQSILVFVGNTILGTTFKYVQLPIRLRVVCIIFWVIALTCFSIKTYAAFRKTKWLSVWITFSIIVGILYSLLINQYPFASTLLSDSFLVFSILSLMAFK